MSPTAYPEGEDNAFLCEVLWMCLPGARPPVEPSTPTPTPHPASVHKPRLPTESDGWPQTHMAATPTLTAATPHPLQEQEVQSTCRTQSAQRDRDSPVKVVEEGEQIERQFTPGLLLTVAQGIRVHDRRWVIGKL